MQSHVSHHHELLRGSAAGLARLVRSASEFRRAHALFLGPYQSANPIVGPEGHPYFSTAKTTWISFLITAPMSDRPTPDRK